MDVHWDLLTVNLGSTDGKVIGFDEDTKLGSTDGEVLDTVLGNTMSRWQA